MKKFLPRLTQEAAPNPQNKPDWHDHDGMWGTLLSYAAALDVPSEEEVAAEKLKSIPSPWARVLLFDHALRQRGHPANRQLRDEWRGILGCIALAERFHLDVRVAPVDLAEATSPVDLLVKMAPDPGENDRWSRWGVIKVNGKAIGGTSPRTLVFTGFRPVGDLVPFREGGRLIDPGRYLVDHNHRDLGMAKDLFNWIRSTLHRLRQRHADLNNYLNAEVPGESPAAAVLRELEEWIDEPYWPAEFAEAENEEEEGEFDAGSSPFAGVFATQSPARILEQLRSLPRVDGGDSDLAVQDGLCKGARSFTVDPGPTGILVRDGQPFNGSIDLPARNGVPITDGRLEPGVTARQLGTDPIDLSGYFSDRLIQVRDVSDSAHALSVGGRSFLLPFREDITTYLVDRALRRYVTARAENDTIVVRFEIPVQSLLSVRYERRYDVADQISDYDSPELVQWPDFQAPNWEHYFFYVRRIDAQNSLKLAPTVDVREEATSSDGSRRWGLCKSPITAWKGSVGQFHGLLLVPTETPPARAEQWQISIDFGSTHTRVFRREIDVDGNVRAEPVPLQERARTVLGHGGDVPGNFFLDPTHPMHNPEEPRSLVRVPPGTGATGQWLPSNGIIHFDSLQNAALEGIRANLKWHDPGSQDESAFQSYIRHLLLSASAEALAQGAQITEIRTAFPSVFPRHLRNNHEEQWRTLEEYGLRVSRAVRESTALAAYLTHVVGIPAAANLIAVDVGGSTADFAVHFNNHYEGDSLRLAGQVVVAAAAKTEEGRAAVLHALTAPPLGGQVGETVIDEWQSGRDEDRALLFNSLLRFTDRVGIDSERFAGVLYQGPGSPGERLIAYAGYLYAALSYYGGIMVRRAELERDIYHVRFAGRGAGFLPWLNQLQPGGSQRLTESFFRAGLGIDQPAIEVGWSSEDAKTEVGIGLLLNEEEEGDLPDHHQTMVGEEGYRTHEHLLEWATPLHVEALAGLQRPEAPEGLPQAVLLERFLGTFNETEAGQAVARALSLPLAADSPELRSRLYQSLFGNTSPWHAAQSDVDRDGLVVEPLLVTEMKAVLKYATELNVPGL